MRNTTGGRYSFYKDNFRKTLCVLYDAISPLLSLVEPFVKTCMIFQGLSNFHVNLFLDMTCYLQVVAGHIYVKQKTQ